VLKNLQHEGTTHQFSCPYKPQQNSVVKTKKEAPTSQCCKVLLTPVQGKLMILKVFIPMDSNLHLNTTEDSSLQCHRVSKIIDMKAHVPFQD